MTPALMYHDVVATGAEDTSGFPSRDAALYKVTPELFEAHLTGIASVVGRAFQARHAGGAELNAQHPIITFDDGGVSAMTGADALERHGLTGHFFITANYVGTRGFVTAQHLRELRARGHVIGSHSCSHPLRMGHCPWPQLLDEWARSRSMLSEWLGEDVVFASVPGGDFAPQVAEAAARGGITQLFTSEPTLEARHAFGLTLHGRFTIQRWTSAATAAALAAGAWLPCARQALVWNAKKLSKRVGGERYLQLRKLLIGDRNEVQWGDQRQ
jgi:peptidoglycan/xylan/chitin deacetylase (PgdA/CDA1 family)